MDKFNTYVQETSARNDFLKVIAILSMLIDHIGYVFFPEVMMLRIIGRLAFPIFAYHISIGYLHTKNFKGYLLRLLIFGLISQIPYGMLFNGGLNIIFTLLLGLLCIYALDHHRYVLLVFLASMPLFLEFEYSYYGLAIIFVFYVFKDRRTPAVLLIAAINLLYFLNHAYSIQIFSLFALGFIYAQWQPRILVNKYIFYGFYPVHIAILYYLRGIFL